MSPRIVVLMGVSGSGKSTVGRALAQRLGWDFCEGDELHPPQNVARMAAGHPLSDAERWPWLAAISRWIDGELAAGRSGVVACSALKRAYRDALRGPGVSFVHLRAPRELVTARVARRHGHFMPASLVDSQFADLEVPQPDEDAITVDVGASTQSRADEIARRLGLEHTGRPQPSSPESG